MGNWALAPENLRDDPELQKVVRQCRAGKERCDKVRAELTELGAVLSAPTSLTKIRSKTKVPPDHEVSLACPERALQTIRAQPGCSLRTMRRSPARLPKNV